MKKALSIVLSLMLLLAVVPVGTISAGAAEDDVIEIRTIAELYNINNNMSGNYKLMNDIDMTNDVAVGGDWDFMGNGWEPIGSNGIYTSKAFTGTFDGDGHKIIGMRIVVNTKPSGTGTIYLGLFSNNAGTIKNLDIDSTSKVSNGYYSGGICAYNSGNISNCINAASVSSYQYSGGISAYSKSGNIIDCHNTGYIYSYSSDTSNYYAFSGGISGHTESGEIKNCYNLGSISSSSNISRSKYYTSDAQSVSSYSFSGGICGRNNSIVNSCYNAGSVSSLAKSRIIGNTPYTLTAPTQLSSYSYAYCGGICGLSNNNNIANCYNTKKITSTATSSSEDRHYPSNPSSASSYNYIGGICGNHNEGNISDCYNTAEIDSSVDSSAIYQYYNKNSDTIIDKAGEVSNSNYNGGIAGYKNKNISGCYNTGNALYGILGNGGSVSNCYYLNGTGNSNSGAKALTSAQLQLEACMPNFDFENTWELDKVTDYKYPQLISNRQELATNPESIEVTLSEKTSYIIGEEFDTSGLVVIGHYDNGISQEIKEYCVSGFTGTLGKNNITVTVGEKIAVFYVTVHDEGEWTTVKQPTCTEKGEKKLYCTDCGDLIKTEEIPAKGHTEVVDKGYDATCTESGLTDGSHCSVCDTILTEQAVIPAKGHTPYQNWETIKNPTCISHGEKVRRCSVCGEVAETANIDVTDHQLVIDESKAATCLTSGLTEGSHCSVCNTVIVPQQVIQPKGHQWDEGEIIKQPTCITTGEKIYHCKNCEQTKTETISALGHNFSDEYTVDKAATCTQDGEKSKHCSRCEAVTDVTVIEKHGHSCDDGTITKQPTCTATGEKVYHCKNCDKTYTETISALGHNFSDEFTIDKEATCTQDGSKSRHCSRCNAITEVTTIEKHNHIWDDGIVTKKPTCTTEGVKTYYCQKCEQTRTETISVLGHKFSDEYTVDKAATCTQDGIKSRHCSRCEAYTDEIVIEKLGHNFSDEFTVDKEATCTEQGSKSRHCSRCDTCTDETIIEKHGHDWNDGTVTNQPTCTTTGEKVYNCKNCEQTKTETLYALGHDFSDEYTVDKAATCTEDGLKSRHCTRCEAHTDEVVIEKHGHHTELVSNHAATYFAAGYTGDKKCTVCGKVVSKGKVIATLKLAAPKVNITAGKQKLTVKYTKVKDSTGFQVKYTFKGNTVTKNFTTTKSITKTINKLKKGTYKVSVRALIKTKGKTAYSSWTKAKTAKVK